MNPAEILQTVGSCMHGITISHGLYLSLFLGGIVGGFTHCVAMCGPFVLSQTGQVRKLNKSLLMPYHLGRITTYTIMAILFSSVLNLAFLFLPIRAFIIAPILMIAGVIFLVVAFPGLAKLFPWAGNIRIAAPYQFVTRQFERLSSRDGFISRYLMGLVLGLMPCGLIVSAVMAAATADHPLKAGLAMMVFGAGTMPALMMLGLSGQALTKKYPAAMKRVTQGMMVWSGLWLFAIAGFVLI